VHPLCASLPLLIHHQSAILDALIARLRPEAALSLDALLSLAGLMAPRLFAALGQLLDDGAERHPEQMVRRGIHFVVVVWSRLRLRLLTL